MWWVLWCLVLTSTSACHNPVQLVSATVPGQPKVCWHLSESGANFNITVVSTRGWILFNSTDDQIDCLLIENLHVIELKGKYTVITISKSYCLSSCHCFSSVFWSVVLRVVHSFILISQIPTTLWLWQRRALRFLTWPVPSLATSMAIPLLQNGKCVCCRVGKHKWQKKLQHEKIWILGQSFIKICFVKCRWHRRHIFHLRGQASWGEPKTLPTNSQWWLIKKKHY